ncbi:MAG TPA: hypothetical protein VG944_22760 [Fimbriimonas sp.]|nr:hypothetical protein [Fimbriimonas sp.]
MPILFLLSATIPGQRAQDPYSTQLLNIVKEDQADRAFMFQGTGKPTKEQIATMTRRDAERFRQTNEILAKASKLTREGLDAAALLMQHGNDLESFVRAHELSACASFLGKPSSLIAAAEDRYLMNLKRKQRFGAQFVGLGNAAKVYATDEEPPTAVTDRLRTIYFEPSLQIAKKEGFAGAFKSSQGEILETIQHRMDPKWISAHSDAKTSRQLASMPATARGQAVVLMLYNANRLVSDDDFSNAARVLGHSKKPQQLLLAHELAAVAFKEGDRKAAPLFAGTWDAFEKSIGHEPRYSRDTEPKCVRAVLEPLQK